MTDAAILLRDGRPIDRACFFRAAGRLADRFAAFPGEPVMPLCSRPGDLALSLVAADRTDRPVIIPHDDDPRAIDRVREGRPGAIVTRSAEDPPFEGAHTLVLEAALVDGPAGGDPPTDPLGPPDWRDDLRVTLYTSGSTGTPVGHAHGPRFLAAAARGWGALLELDKGPISLIPTVPSQHMFGFETCVLLPLGAPTATVMDSRPFFPADIRRALAEAPGRRVLITTPLQLRALVKAGGTPPAVDRVISATAPLSAELARAAEEMLEAPVVEIYGSTETGMLAARRTAHEDAFAPRGDVTLTIGADGAAQVHCAHLPADFVLQDRLELAGDGRRFTLVGRNTDILKVAGKRASLAGLTASLLAVPGVKDGAIAHDPEADTDEATRPVALVVPEPGTTAAGIRRALRERVPAVFVPRRILLVEALPRTGVGKLRAEDLAALIARADEGGTADEPPPNSFTIAADHPALPGHFPGNPIVPGAVILDHALGCAGVEGACTVRSVRFQGVLQPDETCHVTLAARADEALTLHCRTGEGRKILTAVLARAAPPGDLGSGAE